MIDNKDIYITQNIINNIRRSVNMKIVILDGYTLNPGDLSWNGLEKLGELTVYDRVSYDEKDE